MSSFTSRRLIVMEKVSECAGEATVHPSLANFKATFGRNGATFYHYLVGVGGGGGVVCR